jgi:hypothetical protein
MGNKLFIQNLAMTTDSWELESIFTTVGDVDSATVQTISTPNGDKRVGYVQMANAEVMCRWPMPNRPLIASIASMDK